MLHLKDSLPRQIHLTNIPRFDFDRRRQRPTVLLDEAIRAPLVEKLRQTAALGWRGHEPCAGGRRSRYSLQGGCCIRG